MKMCPTCGQPAEKPTEAERLFALLSDGTDRQVYVAHDNSGWWVTYGGGPFSASSVRDLLCRNLIQSCYSDCPDQAYHIGKTMDCVATREERKKHKNFKTAPIIYTDGTRVVRA